MNITVPMGRQQQQQPPPPPSPPLEFPEPFARYAPSDSAYRQPGPQSGNTLPQQSELSQHFVLVPTYYARLNPRVLVPSSRAYPTQPHSFHRPSLPPPVPQSTHPQSSHQPSVPPPIPKSTHPQSSSPPHAPASTPTRHPAPIYENVSRPPPPQPLSRSSSHDPSFPVPLRPERHPHTNSSGSPSPMMQRSTTIPIPSIPSTMPYYDSSPPRNMYQPPHEAQRSMSISIPGNPNTAPPIPYYDSSPPSSVHPPSEPHSEMSGGAQPIERSWSYRTYTTLVYSTTFA